MNKLLPFSKPLVLVPDTDIQHNPKEYGAHSPPPCTISRKSFDIMASGAHHFSFESGFELLKKPAYNVYNDNLFKGRQDTIWLPLMKKQFPIYIVNPFCGFLWPGDSVGLYTLSMEQSFWYWYTNALWKVTSELFNNNKCDGVMAFLPNMYNNIVQGDPEIPWKQYKPEAFLDFVPLFVGKRKKAVLKQKPSDESDYIWTTD